MDKRLGRQRRRRRIRAKVKGTSKRPRLSVFRSNNYLYAQIIDDSRGETLVSFSSRNLSKKDLAGKTKLETAKLVGEALAQKAKQKKIKKVVFDRGGYQYHGRVKALAEGARKGGLEF